MTASFWTNVLAVGTFNSAPGQVLQREASKKLAALDRALPLDLVGKVIAFYLAEAPYELWAPLRKTRPEHADAVIKALKKDKSIQSRLIVAAHRKDGLAGMVRATHFLATVGKTSHLPGTWKTLAKHWATLDGEALAEDAATALGAHGGPRSGEVLPFFGLVFVIARANPTHPVLKKLQKAQSRWAGPWGGRSIDSAIAAAGKP